MTDPNKYALRMILLLFVVGVITWFLFEPLKTAFDGNQPLNTVILGTFFIGILFSFRQTLRLKREANWLKFIKRTDTLLPANLVAKTKPILLAPVAAVLTEDRTENPSLSANSLSTILGGVSSRLDENREILRYMIGLLVFLGLLGTFWGLLQTISSVSNVINTLDMPGASSNENMFNKILNGLNAPMDGMSTAFSSSLFGLGSSLILGFLDLQVGQANNRFFNELEDWLSQMAIFTTTNNESGNIGLGEAALENLAIVSKRAVQNENENVRMSEKLNELNLALNRLIEKLDEEKNIKNSLAELNVSVKNILETEKTNTSELLNGLTIELRALGKQIEKLKK
tara:strand:+ start:1341 stop:2366 length:1026 start_codon:yes stop_codon:yes gene_type:complete